MSIWNFELICTAFNKRQMPAFDVPEIALAGRSNVGKSTLINALFRRTSKKVAYVSSSPGKTRSLNFYRVDVKQDGPHDGSSFCLVDLPGYGYASRGRDERAAWHELIDQYIGHSDRVLFVIHLIDLRHGPLAADDELTEWLDSVDMPRLIVFTKSDKVPRGRAQSLYRQYTSSGLASLAPPLMTCGKDDAEVARLRDIMETAAAELRSEGAAIQ